MNCPKCGAGTTVIRHVPDEDADNRRRMCLGPERHEFETVEYPKSAVPKFLRWLELGSAAQSRINEFRQTCKEAIT